MYINMTIKDLVNRRLDLEEKKVNYQILIQRLDSEIDRIQKLIIEIKESEKKCT